MGEMKTWNRNLEGPPGEWGVERVEGSDGNKGDPPPARHAAERCRSEASYNRS